MNDNIKTDFAEMEKKLKFYIDKGRVTGAVEVKEEPVISIKPDASLIKPLKKVSGFLGGFVAVDCSTRTLKRANNWGIYLMRAAYASVKERDVDWGYKERICTAVGDVHEDVRRTYLLLDGGGYFGGERKFRVSLYEKCEKDGINLLAISKN